MGGAITRVGFGIWLGCFTAAAAQLPPDVMVDKYLLQARMLSEEKDHAGALEAMDQIVSLQKKHDLTLPEEFSFQYAQTALASGAVQAAIESANRYLTAAGREGKYYREALELLVKAERRLQEPAVDRVGSTPVKPDLEPQPQAVSPSSLQAQKTTKAQPEPDCGQWNTRKYFQKATVESVTACLAAGADPMARDDDEETPLHKAAKSNGNPAVIETLLKAGANPNARDQYKNTPLHRAAMFNENLAVIKALIKAGANLKARDQYFKNTPLHWAAMFNENPAVIEVLLAAGANPMVRNDNKRTPLHWARFNKNPAVIKALIKASPDARADLKWTPLHVAVMSNENPAVIETLLKAGANPNARDKDKETPLHWAAARNENPAVIETLLKAGADPMARAKNKRTPLHWAARSNENPAVIETLLKAGANPKARDKDKETPLHEAAWFNGNPAVIETLLAAGADPNAQDTFKRTPLSLANEYNPSVRQALLAAGAGRVESQMAAAKAQRKAPSGGGGGWAALVAGVAGGAMAAASGLDAATATELGATIAGSVLADEAVGSSGTGAASGGTSGNTGATAGGGPCQVPGYPNPPGGVANLGFSWCPASVGLQVRSFALQAAGAECAMATGSSSTPEQIEARRREIRAACDRLASLGQGNCQCPPGLGQ